MKIWRFHEIGDVADMKFEEIDPPVPTADECLVKVKFASLNPADYFAVQGMYPGIKEPPLAVGRDACGIIEQAPANSRFNTGDKVVVLVSDLGVQRNGTLSEYITVPEAALAPLPDGWNPEEGAAATLVHLTAWQGLVDVGELQAGQIVLVTGASGGVGTAAIQQAKALGAKVVALSRSEVKQAKLKELGADWTFDSADENLVKNIKTALEGERANVVIENICGPGLSQCVELTAHRGRIAIVGLLGGLQSELNIPTMIFKRMRIEGVHVSQYTFDEAQTAWKQIVGALDKAGSRPIIDSAFPFEEVPEAFAKLKQGPLGKVLVKVS